MAQSNRSGVLDAVRGIAIILVMVGHVTEVNVAHFFESLTFNVIWSLQMPLFMIISGYVTKYSKPILDYRSYSQYLLKRTTSYILPWVVWTILVKGMLLGKGDIISYIQYIVFTMDAAYWFLFSLWTICLMFGTSTLLANNITEKTFYRIVMTVLTSIVFAALLLVIGIKVGISFLGIKLTLYYLPFFYLGYLFSIIEKDCSGKAWFETTKQAIMLPSIIIYSFIIMNFTLYDVEKTLINIAARVVASTLGCMIVFNTMANIEANISGKVKGILILSGQWSLELYVVHILFVSIIKAFPKPDFLSVNGVVLCSINFALMLLFSILIITVISSNKWSKWFIFGKNVSVK